MPSQKKPARKKRLAVKQPAVQEPEVRTIIRTNIRNRRVELGLTQKDVGDAIGASQQWIGLIETAHGDDVPGVYQLPELASVLKCGAHDLLIKGRFDAGIAPSDDMRAYRHRPAKKPMGSLNPPGKVIIKRKN
jgi:transcriptional regulator with XRE-family HTH domain